MIIEDVPNLTNQTVADIALNFPAALDILNRYNLDYCCNGKKSFVEVCEKANLNPFRIWQEVISTGTNYGQNNYFRFDTWHPGLLVDFIIQHHHQYVRNAIPQIQELLEKLVKVHEENHTELITLRDDFKDLSEELTEHMLKEEEILFPVLKRMFDPGSAGSKHSALLVNVQDPISVMEHEHTIAGDLIKSIRSITRQYTPPEDACTTYKLAYKMLHEFDVDLMRHIHLENNVLFPKAKI